MRVDIRHVGIVVENLDFAHSFWKALGFRTISDVLEDEGFISRLLGFSTPQSLRTLKLEAPGDSTVLVELLEFSHSEKRELLSPNSQGISHVALTVGSIADVITNLRDFNVTLVSEKVLDNPQGTVKVCYLRGPEGVLLELVQENS